MKLFVVERMIEDRWIPSYLHKGLFREVFREAQMKMGCDACAKFHESYPKWRCSYCIRIRWVKTHTELVQYNNEIFFEVNIEDLSKEIEWLN